MNWIYRILMLPITIMVLIQKAHSERVQALEVEYFCECPKDCVLHEKLAELEVEKDEKFKEVWTAVTGMLIPTPPTPADYRRQRMEMACDFCADNLDSVDYRMMEGGRDDWDPNTPGDECPECWTGRTFRWMGDRVTELGNKRLYNIIQAMNRGTWATSGSRVNIRPRMALVLREEYAIRGITDGDIIKIEMANMKWEAKRKKKHREKEEAEIRRSWSPVPLKYVEYDSKVQVIRLVWAHGIEQIALAICLKEIWDALDDVRTKYSSPWACMIPTDQKDVDFINALEDYIGRTIACQRQEHNLAFGTTEATKVYTAIQS